MTPVKIDLEELARFLLFAVRFPVPRFPVPKPGPNAQAEHDAQMVEARAMQVKGWVITRYVLISK